MKISYILLLAIFFSTSASAEAIGVAVQKQIVTTAGEVAIAAINRNKTETTLSNSTIKNDTKMKDSFVLGNAGVSLKGDKIKVSNTKIINKTDISGSALIGNGGIEVGGR